MQRSAAVVLGNVGAAEDVEVLTRAPGDDEPLVREHAAWARDVLDAGSGSTEVS
jgi:epoxyqueuosine reductase QueG